MAFEAYGRLPFGSVFRFLGKNWVKVPLIREDGIWFNAFEPTKTGIPGQPDDIVSVCKVDEAALVSLSSDISEERQERFLQMWAGYESRKKT